jgi:hypothetical protein
MHGPTLTMSSVFDTNSTFPRSHSSSNIPDLVNIDYKRPTTSLEDELPRSASFSCLPVLENPLYNTEKDLNNGISADVISVSSAADNKSGGVTKADTRLSREERPKLERVGGRRKSLVRPKSWIQRVKSSPERTIPPERAIKTPIDAPPVPQIAKVTQDKSKTVSESFANFARKSWITSSRSPSPSRNTGRDTDQSGRDEDVSTSASTISSSSLRRSMIAPPKLEKIPASKPSESPTKTPVRMSTTLLKKKQRPQSTLINYSNLNSANSSTSSLPRSSMENRSTPRTSVDKVPPIPKTFSTERLQSLGIDTARRRDELWSAFRSLENDYSKFQSKTSALKTNVVRSTLLPFLRNHAAHPSNKILRPEDIDRRVNILNKWWTGLLEMLDGRQNQTISGVDRPVLLEAVTGIMARPEWRLAPSSFAPLTDRSPDRRPIPRQRSSGSLSSTASQFLTESVYHNVRNMFIQNLLSQMSLVVDKMSLRHTPASLVTFCGKAAAYAFFFVPGVAEVLVRIWKLQADTLRRVADDLGLPRRINRNENDEVVAAFPPNIQMLGWTSVKSIASQLRQKSSLPLGAAKISWYGPWISRWCGRDSDLFFVFSKHYHILAEEFMPSELSLADKARAPGMCCTQQHM